MNKYHFLFFVFVASYFVYGQESYRLEDPIKVIEKKKRAVVRIQVVSEKADQLSEGTGFFISRDGLLLTNKHVISDFLENKKNKILVTDSNGMKFERIFLANCGDERGIDLCLLKIKDDRKNKVFIVPSLERTGLGNKVYSYGNSISPFVKKEGLILAEVKDIESLNGTTSWKINIGVKTVRTSINLAPGDSGGPVFNQFGELIGINTQHPSINGQVYNIAITSQEISSFVEKSKEKPFKDIAE